MLKRSNKNANRAVTIGVVTIATFGAVHMSASALSAEQGEALSSSSVTPNAQAERSSAKAKSRLTITKDGTIVDGARVKGSILVKADNVTIKNTTVEFGGYHSIRIFPGADGTKIRRSTINCQASRTNGIVFGNYVAKRVHINDCRNDFMSSSRNPAKVLTSWIDGKPFELRGDPNLNPTPTGKPTPTPTSTPTATPTPVAGERPDASNTGVPAGTSLRSSEGMTITQDGAVLDGLHFSGSVTIAADNVTIRNSLVQTSTSNYPIHVTDDATNALIENVEIDNLDSTGIGILFSGGTSGTVRRANIHSAEDGIRIQGDNVTIESSYIHDLHRVSGGHHDSVQIRSGDNISLLGNTLLPYVASTGDPMNAALQIGSLLGDDMVSNLRVIGNYMNGGNYTINGGSEGIVDSAVYSDNRFGRDFRYGVSGNMGAASTWDATNVWDDSGAPAR